MKNVVDYVTEMLISSNLSFVEKPILIGGMAMEYYEMRKAGADIDLIISDFSNTSIKCMHNKFQFVV